MLLPVDLSSYPHLINKELINIQCCCHFCDSEMKVREAALGSASWDVGTFGLYDLIFSSFLESKHISFE